MVTLPPEILNRLKGKFQLDILFVDLSQDDELIDMIDPILASDDKNMDGFIDYMEFVQAQQASLGPNKAQVAPV